MWTVGKVLKNLDSFGSVYVYVVVNDDVTKWFKTTKASVRESFKHSDKDMKLKADWSHETNILYLG